MKNLNPIIEHAALFSGISREETESMLGCLSASPRSYRKGVFIIMAGDMVESVGLMLSGSALIIKEDFWGNRNIITRIFSGQLFAETFACVSGAANFSVEADEPCEVLWMNLAKIMTTCPSACDRHSRLIKNLVTELAAKNLNLNEKLTHMSRRTTREKLLSYLSAAELKNGSAVFDIPFNRQQLADYLSVERSAMSAELCRLRDDGIIEFDKNHFHLLRQGD